MNLLKKRFLVRETVSYLYFLTELDDNHRCCSGTDAIEPRMRAAQEHYDRLRQLAALRRQRLTGGVDYYQVRAMNGVLFRFYCSRRRRRRRAR